MEQTFDMQKLVFFTEGNFFTGSRSQKDKILRYRVEPNLADGELLAWCWPVDKCFERADKIQEARFLLTQEGLDKLLAWLQSCWDRDTLEESGSDSE